MTENLVRIIIERTSAVPITRREGKLIKSIVRREGARRVDTAEFHIPMGSDVIQDDTIKYIQDITATRWLTGLYNFQSNDRDESGWNLDGDEIHTDWTKPQSTRNPNKFRANYGANFDGSATAGSEEITIADDSRFDLSKMFDIHVWVANSDAAGGSNGDRRIFFSKIDRNNSDTNSGIEIGAEKILGLWTMYALIRQAGVETEIKATAAFDLNYATNLPKYVRVWRDENSLVSVSFQGSVDGEEGLDWETVTGSLNSDHDILIGAGRDTSDTVVDRWDGTMFQVRVYCGGYKTEEEAHKIFENAPQPLTMKFCGRVVRIKDGTATKVVHCLSEGKLLLNTNLTSAILAAVHTGELAGRADDNAIFDEMQSNIDIIQSMVQRADDEFIFYEGTGSQQIEGEYAAEGGFVKNVGLLLTMGQDDFFTLPRKVFIVEANDGVTNPLTFNNGGARGEQILSSGKDDTRTVNDLEIIGRNKPRHKTQNTAAITVDNQVESISNSPVSLRITRDDTGAVLTEGTTGDYTVNFDAKTVKFLTGLSINSTCTYEFDYEDLTGSDYFYLRDTDAASITEFGRYSRKIFVPQITNQGTDLVRLGNNILNNNATPDDRIQIVIPFLYNGVRENHKITVVNDTKGINGEFLVKQIEWQYPQNRTVIQCGEIEFDGYDWQVREGDSISGQGSLVVTTKNE